MACNATERSHCLSFTTEDLDQLDSVEEMYFKMREVKEEDKEDDYSDSNSSSDDEGVADQDEPGDDAVELMEIYETERAKVQAFYSETCKCKMGAGEMACSATLSLDDVTECRNNCNELSSVKLFVKFNYGHFAPWSFRSQSLRPNQESLRSIQRLLRSM